MAAGLPLLAKFQSRLFDHKSRPQIPAPAKAHFSEEDRDFFD